MVIELVIAQESDLAFIVDVYNSTIPSRMVTADTEPVTVFERRAWFDQHQRADRPIWIIKCNSQLYGWVSLSSFYGRAAYNKTVEISLYLHQSYRGKGIACSVIEQVEVFCRNQHLETILCFVFAHNQPSIKLFDKLGYQQWGYFPEVAELDGVKRDLVILGKKL